jgi:Putative citrate transport
MVHERFVPHVAWVLPFVAMLLAIAVLPLRAAHFWESNRRKLAVSLLLSLPVMMLYLQHQPTALLHAALDYSSFIILLGGLYVIAGGVVVTGDLDGRRIASRSRRCWRWRPCSWGSS